MAQIIVDGSWENVNINNAYVKVDTNMIEYDSWVYGLTGTTTLGNWGVQDFSAADSYIGSGEDPWGNTVYNIFYKSGTTSTSRQSCWTPYFDIDNTKSYRYSMWIKQLSYNNPSRFYWAGHQTPGLSAVTTGIFDTTPYFIGVIDDKNIVRLNEWWLYVAYIRPYNWTGTTNEGGIYMSDGTLTGSTDDYKWLETSSQARFYTNIPYNSQNEYQLLYPRIDIIDGTEPSFETLLSQEGSWRRASKGFVLDSGDWIQLYPITYLPSGSTKGYWKFDNNSLDSSGNGLNATTGDSISYYSSGLINQAISIQQGNTAAYSIFAPIKGLFTGTDGVAITNNQGITMGGWFYKRSGGGSNQGIIYVGASNILGGFGLYIPYGTENVVYALYGGVMTLSGATISTDTWTHLVFTLDQTAVGGIYYGRIYINGQLVNTITDANPRKPPEAYQMQIGCMAGANQQFYGYVDEAFINVGPVWSQATIQALYDSQKP